MHFAGVFLALTAFSTLSIAGNDDLTTFCNNFSMQGTSLVGTCKLKNGSTVQASIDLTSFLNAAEGIIAWIIVLVFHGTSPRVTSVFNANVCFHH
ncbi:hypothetical protein SCLCIDRAFT_1219773 [Scleroderma citrinum Foug A]|uniref:Cyanovirin-N domain-containing protein n=1 Tax=Scleroderma citrinum Foug A TaxID=1036808 RepID=A0A0C3D8Q9_9AGAM|nr:hypothetical protein SCLCIDRAFT_1219773 [Scleroderma citrinum Foug A]